MYYSHILSVSSTEKPSTLRQVDIGGYFYLKFKSKAHKNFKIGINFLF